MLHPQTVWVSRPVLLVCTGGLVLVGCTTFFYLRCFTIGGMLLRGRLIPSSGTLLLRGGAHLSAYLCFQCHWPEGGVCGLVRGLNSMTRQCLLAVFFPVTVLVWLPDFALSQSSDGLEGRQSQHAPSAAELAPAVFSHSCCVCPVASVELKAAGACTECCRTPVWCLLSFRIFLVVVGITLTRHLSSLLCCCNRGLSKFLPHSRGRACKQLVGQYISGSSPCCGFRAFSNIAVAGTKEYAAALAFSSFWGAITPVISLLSHFLPAGHVYWVVLHSWGWCCGCPFSSCHSLLSRLHRLLFGLLSATHTQSWGCCMLVA